MISKATIIFKDEAGITSFNGFITDPEHAMYVDPDNGDLYMVKVRPSDRVNVFEIDSGHLVLGQVDDGQDEQVITTLTDALNAMSGYDFLKLMVKSPFGADFEGIIIPGLINTN